MKTDPLGQVLCFSTNKMRIVEELRKRQKNKVEGADTNPEIDLFLPEKETDLMWMWFCSLCHLHLRSNLILVS